MNRWLLISLAIIAVGNVMCCHSLAAQGQKLNESRQDPCIPTWISVREHLSDEDWRHVASRYEIVVAAFGNSPMSNERVKWIKSHNPQLRLVVFLSALSLANTGLNPKGDFFAEKYSDWFLKNKAGAWVRTSIFGNILFDPGHKEVQAFLAQKAHDYIEKYGYDGLWLDLVETTTKFPEHNLQKSKIINPKTGEPYTNAEWKTVMMELVGSVRRSIGNKLFLVNGSQGSGKIYFQNAYADFFKHTDGLTYETFAGVFTKSLTAFRKEEEWKSDIDAMVDSVERGQIVLCVGDVKKPADGELKQEYDRLYRFIMSSFLLGKGKKCYLWIYATVPKSAVTWTWRRDVEKDLPDYWSMPSLGEPKGAYSKTDGAYQRDFERGRVLVNPTGRKVAVEMKGQWRTDKGEAVSSPLILDPHTGEILLHP